MDVRHYEVKCKFLKMADPIDPDSIVLLSNRRYESIPSSQLACYSYILTILPHLLGLPMAFVRAIHSLHSFLLSLRQFLVHSIQYRFETLSSNLLSVCNSSLPSYTLDHVLSLFHSFQEVDCY